MPLRRRDFLSVGLLTAAGCVELPSEAPDASSSSASDAGAGSPYRAGPLAQDYTIVSSVPNDGTFSYMHDPGMVQLPSGVLLAATPCWQTDKPGNPLPLDDPKAFQTFIVQSRDGGVTWATVCTLAETSDATPFVSGGRLYMFVQNRQFVNFSLVASDDEGATWTAPTVIFTGSFWNCSTSMVSANGKLYWAVQSDGFAGTVRVLVADTSGDLLDPSRWSMSAPANHPATPAALVTPDQASTTAKDEWLEPNIVEVNGVIRVYLRTVLANQYTAGIAVMCTLNEDTSDPSGLRLDFNRYAAVPGGQCKCFLVADGALTWMLSNLPVDSQESVLLSQLAAARATVPNSFLGSGGNDRRFLMLSYSLDALNWFPAGCVARAALLRQSFMYPSAVIDGDDLLVLSRTSIDGPTQHNADHVTFHRVTSFRALALDLLPG